MRSPFVVGVQLAVYVTVSPAASVRDVSAAVNALSALHTHTMEPSGLRTRTSNCWPLLKSTVAGPVAELPRRSVKVTADAVAAALTLMGSAVPHRTMGGMSSRGRP